MPDGQTRGARAGKDFQRSADETTMTIVIMTIINIMTIIVTINIIITPVPPGLANILLVLPARPPSRTLGLAEIFNSA